MSKLKKAEDAKKERYFLKSTATDPTKKETEPIIVTDTAPLTEAGTGGINIPPPPTQPPTSDYANMTEDELPEKAPQTDFSPIVEPVIQRDYSSAPPLAAGDMADIDEPVITKAPVFTEKPLVGDKPKTPLLTNPELIEATNEERKEAAESAVDMALEGYTALGELGCKYLTVPPETIMQLADEDKIDPSDGLADGHGGAQTIGQFVEKFNREAAENMKVTPEFIEKVRPPMIRVAMKRNIGLTDEQKIAGYFAKDFGMKVMTVISFKKTMNAVIGSLMKHHEERKAMGETINEQERTAKTQAQIIADLSAKLAEMEHDNQSVNYENVQSNGYATILDDDEPPLPPSKGNANTPAEKKKTGTGVATTKFAKAGNRAAGSNLLEPEERDNG